jgi:hypothetical protein
VRASEGSCSRLKRNAGNWQRYFCVLNLGTTNLHPCIIEQHSQWITIALPVQNGVRYRYSPLPPKSCSLTLTCFLCIQVDQIHIFNPDSEKDAIDHYVCYTTGDVVQWIRKKPKTALSCIILKPLRMLLLVRRCRHTERYVSARWSYGWLHTRGSSGCWYLVVTARFCWMKIAWYLRCRTDPATEPERRVG